MFNYWLNALHSHRLPQGGGRDDTPMKGGESRQSSGSSGRDNEDTVAAAVRLTLMSHERVNTEGSTSIIWPVLKTFVCMESCRDSSKLIKKNQQLQLKNWILSICPNCGQEKDFRVGTLMSLLSNMKTFYRLNNSLQSAKNQPIAKISYKIHRNRGFSKTQINMCDISQAKQLIVLIKRIIYKK